MVNRFGGSKISQSQVEKVTPELIYKQPEIPKARFGRGVSESKQLQSRALELRRIRKEAIDEAERLENEYFSKDITIQQSEEGFQQVDPLIRQFIRTTPEVRRRKAQEVLSSIDKRISESQERISQLRSRKASRETELEILEQETFISELSNLRGEAESGAYNLSDIVSIAESRAYNRKARSQNRMSEKQQQKAFLDTLVSRGIPKDLASKISKNEKVSLTQYDIQRLPSQVRSSLVVESETRPLTYAELRAKGIPVDISAKIVAQGDQATFTLKEAKRLPANLRQELGLTDEAFNKSNLQYLNQINSVKREKSLSNLFGVKDKIVEAESKVLTNQLRSNDQGSFKYIKQSASLYGLGFSKKIVDLGIAVVNPIETGKGIIKSLANPIQTAKGFRENVQTEFKTNPQGFLGGLTADIVIIKSPAIVKEGVTKVSDLVRTRGLKEIPSSQVIAPEFFKGQKYPAISKGQTAGELLSEFKPLLPEETKPAGFTASPNPFKTEKGKVIIKEGSSEFKGLYQAPKISPAFLKVTSEADKIKIFALNPFDTLRPTAFRITPESFELLGVRYSQKSLQPIGKARELFKGAVTGKSFVTFIKTEKESIIPAGTELIKTNKRYFFRFEDRKIPIFEYQTYAKGSNKIKNTVNVKQIYDKSYSSKIGKPSSIVNPLSSSYAFGLSSSLTKVSSSKSPRLSSVSYSKSKVLRSDKLSKLSSSKAIIPISSKSLLSKSSRLSYKSKLLNKSFGYRNINLVNPNNNIGKKSKFEFKFKTKEPKKIINKAKQKEDLVISEDFTARQLGLRPQRIKRSQLPSLVKAQTFNLGFRFKPILVDDITKKKRRRMK